MCSKQHERKDRRSAAEGEKSEEGRDHNDSSSAEFVLMVPGLRSECARRIS